MDPEDASTIEDIVAGVGKRPRGGGGGALLVIGDLNTNLAAPEAREWYKGIVVALEEEGLEDMSGHSLPRQKPWLKHGHKWAMYQGSREVRSWTNYILGVDSRLFQNLSVRDKRQKKDHYLILGCL